MCFKMSKKIKHEVFLPDKVLSIKWDVLKETRSWVENKGCPGGRRIYIVYPDGGIVFKDQKNIKPEKKNRYFMEFEFKDGSVKTYRMWKGVFIQVHLDMYKHLDKMKAKTLAEANGLPDGLEEGVIEE